jgi:hypothetical protein
MYLTVRILVRFSKSYVTTEPRVPSPTTFMSDRGSRSGAVFSPNPLSFPAVITILPLLHTVLSLPPEKRDSPEQAAHYHIFGFQWKVPWSVTRPIAEWGRRFGGTQQFPSAPFVIQYFLVSSNSTLRRYIGLIFVIWTLNKQTWISISPSTNGSISWQVNPLRTEFLHSFI